MTGRLFSIGELRDIAGRASTIDERLGKGGIRCEIANDAERGRAQRRLAAWCHSAAAANRELFAKRLASQGLNESSALDLLGTARLADDRALPLWAETFGWLAPAFAVPARPFRPATPQEPLPFEDLLGPLADIAWDRFAEQAHGRLLSLIDEPARVQWRDSLLHRIARACARALFADFNLYRHASGYAPGRLAVPFWSSDSRAIYDGFVSAWRTGRYHQFFLANPVAARLLGTTVAHWLAGAIELLDRLERDRPALREAFGRGADLGPVTSLDADLSDPHRGGRSVAILGFADGTKVVYKPKDLRTDIAWSELLCWIAARGAPTVLHAPEVVARNGYGWTEYIAADDTAGGDDGAAFHRRAGALLALFHLLRGTDFHNENVIVADGQPVPVDVETLLHPELVPALREDPGDPAATAAAALTAESVLATLYLPHWVLRPAGGAEAIGGLDRDCADVGPGSPFRHVNTDAMAIVSDTDPIEAAGARNASRLADHIEDLIAGFTALYEFVLSNRNALLADDGPIVRFAAASGRVVLAPTTGYALIRQRASNHQHLGDGAEWSLHFDFLCRGWLVDQVPPQRWQILAAERRALANLDVPVFFAQADREWLETNDGERIAGCLAGTPIDQVIARISALGDRDLAFQRRLIRGTVDRAVDGEPPAATRRARAITAQDAGVAMARRLGEILDSAAIRAGDSAAWIGRGPIDHDHRSVRAIGLNLYAGATGIALFLAALGRIDGDNRFGDLAVAALGPVRSLRAADDGGARAARLIGLGGGLGIGSIVYGLARIAQLVDEPALLDEAGALARLVDEAPIARDESYDVMQGSAGAILGLLALYRVTGDGEILERATACGRHLLGSQTVDHNGNKGWRPFGDRTPMLAGFAHGAAGIALALLRLSRATGDGRFRAAAVDALAYERRLFRPDVGNWPDLRFADGAGAADPPCHWCHGATGIGLARLGCRDLIEDEAITGEIETALATTQQAATAPLDHLCCGNFGRVDFLLTAGLRLNRPDLVRLARDRAAERIEHAAGRGFPWLGGDDAMNPSLFQGIAGIGYELLRLDSPELLSSVLLWE
jgi:class II lanthipeptide synthase